jgi:hypothetical protein
MGKMVEQMDTNKTQGTTTIPADLPKQFGDRNALLTVTK